MRTYKQNIVQLDRNDMVVVRFRGVEVQASVLDDAMELTFPHGVNLRGLTYLTDCTDLSQRDREGVQLSFLSDNQPHEDIEGPVRLELFNI